MLLDVTNYISLDFKSKVILISVVDGEDYPFIIVVVVNSSEL